MLKYTRLNKQHIKDEITMTYIFQFYEASGGHMTGSGKTATISVEMVCKYTEKTCP